MSEIIEKKKLKKEFNILAGVLIGYGAMAYVVMIPYVFIKTIGIVIHNFENEQRTMQLLEGMTVDLLSNGILPMIGVLLGMIFILFYRKKQFFTYDLIHINRKMNPKQFFFILICFMAPQFLFTLTSELFEWVLNGFGYSILESMQFVTQGSQSLSMFLYTVLIGPIAEEFVFRGAILRSLEKHGKIFAIVLSSVLFGALHGNFVQGFYAALVGLVLGYVALEYSFKWCVFLHIGNNILSEIFAAMNANESQISITIDYIVSGAFFVGSCMILYSKRKEIRAFLERNKTDKKIYSYVFTSLWMVVFLVVQLLLAISGIEKLDTSGLTDAFQSIIMARG